MQKESHSQSSLNINMNITGYVLVLCAVWGISGATFGIFKQKRKHRHGSFGGYLSDLKEVVDGILSFAPDFYETIPKVAHKLLHHNYEHGHSHKGHKHHSHDEYDDGHYHKEHKHHHHHHHKGSHYGPAPLPYHYGVPQYHYDGVPYGHGYPHLDHSIYNDPFHIPETHSVGHLYNDLNSLHHDGLIY